MATYDFGNLATPVKSSAKTYDFGGLATPASKSSVDQIPGYGPSSAPAKTSDPSLGDKLIGAGEAGLSMATGAYGAAAGGSAALGDILTNGKYGTQAGVKSAGDRFSRVASENTYSPRTETGKDILGKVGDAAEKYGIPVMPTTEFAQLGQSLPKSGMLKAAAADSTDLYALKQGAKAVGDKIPSMNIKLTPEMQDLYRSARDKYGINLQPHHLSDNKFVRLLGETMEKIPFSGSNTAANQTSLERALIAQIGGDAKANVLTPKVFDQAMRRSGTTIDAITRKYDLVPDKPFLERLTKISNEAGKFETPENAKIIANHVDEVLNKMSAGQMSGTAFRKMNTALGRRIRNTADGDLKNALSDLQDTLLEKFNDGIGGEDKSKFLEARTQYAKAKSLAPVVGDPKGVSGSKLLSSVRNTKANKERYARGQSGDMGELADIGQLLKDPGSSNTAERGLVYGALGTGLGGLVNPAFAVPAGGLYGAANLYNRFGSGLIPKVPKR